jgi:hypothetical protein
MRLSRRKMVQTTALSFLPRLSRAQTTPSFVLVPGAWHGRWAFDALVDALARRGFQSDALCLTGVGERRDASLVDVTLDQHIDDVRQALDRTTDPKILVGHSYAGIPITPAAVEARNLHALVYLDAFVPVSGDSVFSLMKSAYVASWRKRAGDTRWVPPMLTAKNMGIDNVTDTKAVDARLTPHPLHTLETPVHFDQAAWARLPKTYIRCRRFAGFGPMSLKAKALGCALTEIDAGHDAMISSPEALARLLGRIARR